MTLPFKDDAAALHDPMPGMFIPREMVPRNQNKAQFDALVSLAMTERRIACRYREDAAKYEASGNYRLFAECRLQARAYQRRALEHIGMARLRYQPQK